MNDLAISIRDISKKYQIGRQNPSYRTARDTIVRRIGAPFHRARRIIRGEASGAAGLDQDFWALKNISFNVSEGEVVGIIGRNGAGKSTLLKILSQVTEPTEGFADIFGRVGALLEVGTGFHNELTGRENVFFNGAILGMSRREVNRRFEEIVDFAEVEKFIDTPTKYFSSGMRLRLAFSVAAYLDPEILIVDEVLAVGDAAFRKKCLDRMEGVSKEGRTVLFVSHNMTAISRLCQRVIMLDEGQIVADGPAHQVVQSYLNSDFGEMAERIWTRDIPGDSAVRLHAARIGTDSSSTSSVVNVGQKVYIEMDYEITEPDHVFVFYIELFNEDGTCIFTSIDTDKVWHRRPRPTGRYTSQMSIPGDLLQEGTVFVDLAALTLDPIIQRFRENAALTFHVVIEGEDPDYSRRHLARAVRGTVRPFLKWTTYENGEQDSF